ncbi:MAG: hypothetical protein JJ992_05715, partial [Planctomycetes bacterium]|nr:hypothetical protein [Planctomycetota bacterium]
MTKNILYFGDTTLDSAAAYLAGLIHHRGWSFDYVPSDQAADVDLLAGERALYILSDYPAAQLETALQELIVARVAQGSGLLMIGGWESFRGCDGQWQETRTYRDGKGQERTDVDWLGSTILAGDGVIRNITGSEGR